MTVRHTTSTPGSSLLTTLPTKRHTIRIRNSGGPWYKQVAFHLNRGNGIGLTPQQTTVITRGTGMIAGNLRNGTTVRVRARLRGRSGSAFSRGSRRRMRSGSGDRTLLHLLGRELLGDAEDDSDSDSSDEDDYTVASSSSGDSEDSEEDSYGSGSSEDDYDDGSLSSSSDDADDRAPSMTDSKFIKLFGEAVAASTGVASIERIDQADELLQRATNLAKKELDGTEGLLANRVAEEAAEAVKGNRNLSEADIRSILAATLLRNTSTQDKQRLELSNHIAVLKEYLLLAQEGKLPRAFRKSKMDRPKWSAFVERAIANLKIRKAAHDEFTKRVESRSMDGVRILLAQLSKAKAKKEKATVQSAKRKLVKGAASPRTRSPSRSRARSRSTARRSRR